MHLQCWYRSHIVIGMEKETNALEVALGTQIRVELATHDWTQQALADKVGITRETLSKYMKGHRQMPMPVFFAIAEAFGHSPKKFMELVEDRISPEDRWF